MKYITKKKIKEIFETIERDGFASIDRSEYTSEKAHVLLRRLVTYGMEQSSQKRVLHLDPYSKFTEDKILFYHSNGCIGLDI